MSVRCGLEILRDLGYEGLHGRRVGIFATPSAVDQRLESAVRILTRADGLHVSALFSAEHGISGAVAAGEKVESAAGNGARLPVHSLYGETFRPTAEMLQGLDVIVCDIQDVGARFYTYIWTLSHLLEAAGEAGIKVLILDRPNPLGGEIDGEMLDPELASLVGRYPIPIQHGMTVGELSSMINERFNPTPAPLRVIPCLGWRHSMTWEQTGLPWVPTSPNMPHISTVRQYPGACLVEGTNLSEGRGTALPFEIVGAPFIDGETLADRLNAMQWIGVRFRPHTFIPSASKWAGETCQGVQVHITEPSLYFPIRVWVGVIMAVESAYPTAFQWDHAWFDRLAGSARLRHAITAGKPHREIVAAWDEGRVAFAEARTPYLLYD
ncbi:MAG: DUF1343 domain-containing protein [bacterium]|nr:DUF1343 domain-containing protein [bacterium]